MRLRSILFSPADRPERVAKALASGAADVVVADLEDGVAPANKAAARIAAAEVLSAPGAKAVRAVRINAWPGTAAEADLDAVLDANPELIFVPKSEDVDAVQALAARLEGSDAGLVLILETAAGVLAARELAACDRVIAICFGAEDLAADAGMRRSRSNREVSVPRAMVSLAAAAAGRPAIDMITADYTDQERLKEEATEARNLGFAGKMCIHPQQCPVVHEAFAASPEELAWAKKVVAAAQEGGAANGGVVVVDGKMIDVPLIRQAKRIISQK